MKTKMLLTLVLLSLFSLMVFAYESAFVLPDPSVTPSDQLAEPSIGAKDAPVLIEEFSDLECPFCKRFHDATWPLLKKEFIDTGKVRFTYTNLPLSFHKNAYSAALAGECAHEQGKFWEMHGKIFDNQTNLGELVYKKLAQQIGLDSTQFTECLDNKKYAAEVSDDFLTIQKRDVHGTPTFFINGKILVGAQPYENFRWEILKAIGEPYNESGDQIIEPVPAGSQPSVGKIPAPLVILPDEPVVEEPTKEENEEAVPNSKQESSPPVNACDDGCTLNGKCMGVSSRFFAGGEPAYCGVELEIKAQKQVGYFCQNNFECLSNACSNGACVDLQKEIQETKDVLQQVLGWLSGLFGFKPR